LGVAPGEKRVVRAPPDAEIVVSRFDVRLFDVARVDVELSLPEADVTAILRDVRVDPRDGALYTCCERDLAALTFGSGERVVVRVVGERDGRRQELAVFEGLPSLGG
jgi:hypothetical protein